MKKIALNIFAVLVLSAGCTALYAQTQRGEVTVNQSREVDALLELKKDLNRLSSDFKIQIYNGNRSGAEKARSEFLSAYPGWRVSMEYETPNYKIWVGNFKTRLEADRALLRVKQNFPNAFYFMPNKKKN